MQVITLAQVKTYLGITGSTQDAAITAMLPIIDAKVKLICGQSFNKQFFGKLVGGSADVTVYGDDELELLQDALQSGTQIYGDGIPVGAYITEVYYESFQDGKPYTPYFTLSANATATTDPAYLYAGINIAYLPVIAKGVQWLMNQQSTEINDSLWTSRSVGPLSVAKSVTDNKLEQKFGMPAWFVKALPRFHK